MCIRDRSVLVCLVLMAGCFCMAMLPMLWDELSGENQQTMNRLSAQAIDELYTTCKQDAQDIPIRDISGRMFLSGPQAETLQQAAALPAGDVYLTLTVELFGPYDSAAAFARDCYTLTEMCIRDSFLCAHEPHRLRTGRNSGLPGSGGKGRCARAAKSDGHARQAHRHHPCLLYTSRCV